MKIAFEPGYIGECELRNRFVRSATHAGYADAQGMVTDELLDYVQESASGGVALFITGHAYVSEEGKASPRQLGAYADDCILGLSRLAATIHKGGAKAFLQLAHAGGAAREKVSGQVPVGPVVIREGDAQISRAATREDIVRMVAAFTRAAERAEASGFDGVQIHAAHGYCLSQFLSSYYNTRTDAYGGGIENRMRFLCEVVESIRSQVLKTFPVIVKINSEDFLEGGFTKEEMLVVSKALVARGVDAIELSGGTIDSDTFTPIRKGVLLPKNEVFYRDAAHAFKESISCPLILVGGMRSPEVIENLLAEGCADYVSLSRPLIREPHLVAEWKKGRNEKARCVSCNLCFRPLMTSKGVYCVVEKKKSQG